jgi:retron-type reverse transcriptase
VTSIEALSGLIRDKVCVAAAFVVMTILNQIYEEDFKGLSYGFRPGRSPHQALDALYVGLVRRKVSWVRALGAKSKGDLIP